MAVIGELLFYTGRNLQVSDALRNNLQNGVSTKVERLTQRDFDAHSDDELRDRIVEECRAEPIILKLAESKGGAEPKQIAVQNVFGERVVVPGLLITQTIPFDGEAQFFHLCPNQFDQNPPHGTIRGKTLILGMEVRESDAETAMKHIEETRTKVQTWIDRQAGEIAEHNQQLPGVAIEAIKRRRATFSKASDIASRLSGQ